MSGIARRRRQGRSAATVGLVALLVLSALVFLGFTKKLPFTRGFQIQAQFESANSIRQNSPVRIAGVNVGKVVGIDATEDAKSAVLTLEIDDEGLPIHEDATAKIRPRIFLEGNFFVDLSPGTPGAEELEDGDTIKVTQTATPVQLDEVLTTLQEDTREDLKDVLAGLALALDSKPTAADDAQADPDTRGETAAQSINDSYDDAAPAFRSTAVVSDALLGTEPDRDLSRLLAGTARVTGALARSETALQDFVTNFNATMAAFAAEDEDLRASIRELGPTLEQANPTLAALNEAFPATRAFAREILPGVRETPETIEASFPWIEQTRRLVSRGELGGLAADLRPATADLASLTDSLISFLPQQELASRCAADVVLPTGDVVIRDEFETGKENYKEFFYGLVGLAGEGQNFDGNTQYVRFQTGGGSTTTTVGQNHGSAAAPPIATRPAYPGRRSPYRPDAVCHRQKLPDLNGPAAARGPSDATRTPATATKVQGAEKRMRVARLARLREDLRPFGSRREEGSR